MEGQCVVRSNEKVIGLFFVEELTVTGDHFLAMRHVPVGTVL
jgi:hypothetical protein